MLFYYVLEKEVICTSVILFQKVYFLKKKENSVAIKWLYSEYLLVTDTGGILIPFNYGLDFCFDSRPWVESP